jgi:hypothetical protein
MRPDMPRGGILDSFSTVVRSSFTVIGGFQPAITTI